MPDQKPLDANDYEVGSLVIAHRKLQKVIKLSSSEQGERVFKEIGNFALKIIAKSGDKYLFDINGHLRVGTLDFTTSVQKFRGFIRPFTFQGSPLDLENLTQLVCETIKDSEENSFIYIKNRVGWWSDGDYTMWIFRDHLLVTHKKGVKLPVNQLVPIVKGKVFTLDDKQVMIENSDVNKTMVPVYKEDATYTLGTFYQEWTAQLKSKVLLNSLLGWIVACLFFDQVNALRKKDSFPFFVITAETEAGKTALLENCIKMLGVDYIGENYAKGVSPFVEIVECSQLGHLPLWRDEYKNEGYALKKEPILRSVFTRADNSRGNPDKSVTRYPTNAMFLLSGEDITQDPALYRRMILFRLKKHDKVDLSQHETNCRKASENFGKAFPLILNSVFDEEVFQDIMKLDFKTSNEGVDELMCYAALGAVFGKEVALRAVEESNDYHEVSKGDIIAQRESSVDRFFTQLNSIFIERGYFEDPYKKPRVLEYISCYKSTHIQDILYKDEENADPSGLPKAGRPSRAAFFRYSEAIELVSKAKGRDDYSFSERALGQLLMEKFNAKREPRYFRGQSCRVMVFEEWETTLSGQAKELFEKVASVEEEYDKRFETLESLD